VNFIHVTPATTDVWRLQKCGEEGFTLVWEPTPINSFVMGTVASAKDVTAIDRRRWMNPPQWRTSTNSSFQYARSGEQSRNHSHGRRLAEQCGQQRPRKEERR
jgi:hypothetical protein